MGGQDLGVVGDVGVLDEGRALRERAQLQELGLGPRHEGAGVLRGGRGGLGGGGGARGPREAERQNDLVKALGHVVSSSAEHNSLTDSGGARTLPGGK
jgi:hypothetical protein